MQGLETTCNNNQLHLLKLRISLTKPMCILSNLKLGTVTENRFNETAAWLVAVM